MAVTSHARLPAEDTAQKLLFSSSDPVGKSGVDGWEHAAAEVYPGGSFRSDLAVARRLAFLDGRPSRAQAQELLRNENAFAPLTPEQRANLEAAGSDRAVFLITGQQPGIFGGPILWLYKALTCAAMAKEWSARLSRPVIPIFWVAGDDADLQECNHVELLDARASEVAGPLSLPFPDASRPIPVSERHVDPGGLAALLARLSRIWGSEIVDALRRCYPVPSTLTAGFLRLAQTQLGKEGVLFVDGYSKRVRTLARPVLEQAVFDWDGYQAALIQGTKAAEAAGIPAQVGLRDGVVHAFALIGGERHRLFGERLPGNGERLPGNRNGATADRVSEGIADRIYIPEQPKVDLMPRLSELELTHDVFTRPLIADAIFPVLGHILGPAELRYFGQMSRLFLQTTGDMPLLHPRMTATVAPRAAWEDFQAEGIDVQDMVRLGESGLRTRLEDRVWRAHPASTALSADPGEQWLQGLRQVHGQYFRDAGPLQRFEKTMGLAWKRYLRSLERMAFDGSAQYKRKLFEHLQWLGGGMGQDRHMSLPTLLNALGNNGLAALRAAMDPTKPELQVFLFTNEDRIQGA